MEYLNSGEKTESNRRWCKSLETLARDMISDAIEKCGHDLSKAAEFLGIAESSLLIFMSELDLKPSPVSDFRNDNECLLKHNSPT